MEQRKWEVPRAYTGDDGKSHWATGTLTLEPVDARQHGGGEFTSHVFGKQQTALLEFPPGFTCDFHQGVRSVVMMMKGRVRFDLNDGTHIIVEPGDVAMFDDTEGGGHAGTALDGEGAVAAVLEID